MAMGKLTDKEAAQIAKALGDPNRLAIYAQIAQGEELYCGEICERHTISPATISHHLKVLTDLGLVTSRKEGLNVYYRSQPEKIAAYRKYLTELGGK